MVSCQPLAAIFTRNSILIALGRSLTGVLRTFTGRAKKLPLDGYYETPAAGLIVLRSDRTPEPSRRILKPVFGTSVQGSKRAVVGEQRFNYSAGGALLLTVESCVVAPSPNYSQKGPFSDWSSN